jgi:phage tail-like protein
MMSELVQSFKFQVWLTGSGSPGATQAPPPDLKATEQAPSPSSAPQPAADPAQLGDGRFQECTGLDLEADVHEYLEGGRNDGIIRRLGRVKLQPIVLKRGIFVANNGGYADTALWKWLQATVDGTLPLPRYNGTVEVLDPADPNRVTARWTFTRGLPMKVTGPQLNARTGEIAIEELHLVHEGLSMEDTP